MAHYDSRKYECRVQHRRLLQEGNVDIGSHRLAFPKHMNIDNATATGGCAYLISLDLERLIQLTLYFST